MNARVWAAAFVAAAALVVGFEVGDAAAANHPPVAGSGTMTVRYQDSYSINFLASDADGDPLTVTSQPVNEDWIGCDGGPAENFSCDYSSSRYDGTDPLPSAPFQRTISYTVSDGSSTATGVWTVTVLPPPTMQISGEATVTEGNTATLHVQLSANDDGAVVVPAHLEAVDDSGGATTPFAPFMFTIGDGQTGADITVPIPDDDVRQAPRHYTVVVDRLDAIPYRFVPGGNRITVLDNDGSSSADVTAPGVGKHRDITVLRGGQREARVIYDPPSATDDVDGPLTPTCTPAPAGAFANGVTTVVCTAADRAHNQGTASFTVDVHRVKDAGDADLLGRHGGPHCVSPGRPAWVLAEGFDPNQQVTIAWQTPSAGRTTFATAITDRRGRLRTVVVVPNATVADADVVVLGAAGQKDLQVMIPVRVAHRHDGRHVSWHALTQVMSQVC
jgi:hypothetical protein